MNRDTRLPCAGWGNSWHALRANDPDAYRQWLSSGEQDLTKPMVEEPLLDWLAPFLTVEE